MKTNLTNNAEFFKPLTVAVAIAMGAITMQVNAEEMTQSGTQYDTSWQSPLAAEFSALDTTGNGLLLPNEASKGKAFNKSTFAKADVNKDGYIDQDEYIYFKTGAWPVVAKPNIDPNEVNLPDSASSTTSSEGDTMMMDDAGDMQQ
jgi:hypothetical protein